MRLLLDALSVSFQASQKFVEFERVSVSSSLTGSAERPSFLHLAVLLPTSERPNKQVVLAPFTVVRDSPFPQSLSIRSVNGPWWQTLGWQYSPSFPTQLSNIVALQFPTDVAGECGVREVLALRQFVAQGRPK